MKQEKIIRVDTVTYKLLREIAKKDGRTLKYLVTRAIQNFLKAKKVVGNESKN